MDVTDDAANAQNYFAAVGQSCEQAEAIIWQLGGEMTFLVAGLCSQGARLPPGGRLRLHAIEGNTKHLS